MAINSSTKVNDRAILLTVALMAVLTLIFGYLQIRKSISLPFVKKPSAVVFKTQDQLDQERMALLKVKDTDGDGLTDYDELYIYRTSPYLEDSDSDGDSDSKEIAEGNDPNCPKNRVCREARTSTATSGQSGGESSGTGGSSASQGTASSSGSAANVPQAAPESVQAFIDTFGQVDQLTPQSVAAKIDSMSAKEMRDFFIKMGVDKATTDAADETTLRDMLYESFAELGIDAKSASQ